MPEAYWPSCNKPLALTGHAPLSIEQPDRAWRVERGWVDIFLVTGNTADAMGVRHHVRRVEQGEWFTGLPNEDADDVIAVGLDGTTLSEARLTDIAPSKAQLDGFASAGRAWWEAWASRAQAMHATASQDTPTPRRSPSIPTDWTTCIRTKFAGLSTALTEGRQGLRCEIRYGEEIGIERRHARHQTSAQQFRHSLGRLRDVLSPGAADQATSGALWQVCHSVAERQHLKLSAMPSETMDRQDDDAMDTILRANGLFSRRIRLDGTWWTHDGASMISSDAEGNPVAILTRGPARYEAWNPVKGERYPITAATADRVSRDAFVIGARLPDEPLSSRDLWGFLLKRSRDDIVRIIALGLLAGLMSLVTPKVTQWTIDRIIPSGDLSQLWGCTVALLAATVAAMVFSFVRNVGLVRILGRAGGELQQAMWDRIIRLPVDFFRRFEVGDLNRRVSGITEMAGILRNRVANALLSGMFSLFSLLLMFYYSVTLSLYALLIVGTAMLVASLAGYLQVRLQRKTAELDSRLDNLQLQLVSGISKVRVAAAESRAFGRWAKPFAEQSRLTQAAGRLANTIEVWNLGLPLIGSMVLFSVMILSSIRGALTAGEFLGFSAAFAQLLLAGTTLSNALISSLQIIPLWQRMRPLCEACPEITGQAGDPGTLNGQIEVSNVTFGYDPDKPPVLHDVSLTIEPGQFVAVVGPSGSGKSTLLRILLGFDRPQNGAVFYDGQDLAHLDLAAVRRQMGVVLQQGGILGGDIFTNVAGAGRATRAEVQQAIEMAGMKEDIDAMPMGLATVVDQGASTLSGGQKQRLLIARALVNRPKILFFDEATSALDNRTQAIVSESVSRIHATRVVIAHRLSTIRSADCIYVMQRGRLVETGTYEELIEHDGVFASLARRQIA